MDVFSFKELVEDKELNIVIPNLQRDFAYGRTETDVKEKRETFLDDLKKYFKSKDSHKLDLIYGSVNNGELVLLDGQQRVTIVFLLHWYLSLVNDANGKNHFSDFKKLMLYSNGDSKRSHLSYQTRKSSEEFCVMLVSLETKGGSATSSVPVDHSGTYARIINRKDETPISEIMKKEKWFLPNWSYDPTVSGMLTMLDEIKEKFPADECAGYYDMLTNPPAGEEPKLVFNFLPLNDFGLTNDLYIKMNSRGKALTKLENIKSILLPLYDEAKNRNPTAYNTQLMKLNNIGETLNPPKTMGSLREWVTYLFDTVWTDAFWKIFIETDWKKWDESVKRDPKEEPNPRVDDMMLSFITVMAINDYIVNMGVKEDTGADYRLASKYKEDGITYQDFEVLFKAKDYSFLFNMIDYFHIFVPFGAKLHSCSNFDPEMWLGDFLARDYEKPNQKNYAERFKVFVFARYCREFPNSTRDQLENWVRFAFNVADNSDGVNNSAKEFCQALNGIDSLCKQDIADYLKNHLQNRPTKITVLDNNQITEEKIKFTLSDNANWKKALMAAEADLPYFKGNLSFPLMYCCGIDENSVNAHLYNDTTRVKFINYVEKLKAIFPDEDGCQCESDLIRAVLSKGVYLLRSKRNYSLRINKDRDLSWKRYLKEKPTVTDGDKQPIYEKTQSSNPNKVEYEDIRKFFKEVLDDVNFDPKNVQNSLKVIVDICVNDSNKMSGMPLWRQLLIKHPEVIDGYDVNGKTVDVFKEGNGRLLRWHEFKKSDDGGAVVLFTKKAFNGEHSELFSLCKFLELRRDDQTMQARLEYVSTNTEGKQPHFSYNYTDTNGKTRTIKVFYQSQTASQSIYRFELDDKTEIQNIASDQVGTELKKYG